MNIITTYQTYFKKQLQKYIDNIRQRHPKELYEPNAYILSADAKHIRPVLCLMACELYGRKYSAALHAALAIELFHNFSLIHDDILDNSPIRRGKKTVHTKWNTNIAILAGDVLLAESYYLLTKYPTDIAHSLLKLFTKSSIQICEGQQEDMNFEHQKNVSTTQYLDMIRKKTAVLLGTSLQMGAIVARASIQEQKKLYHIGQNIGIAFQIMDDYLDTFGSTNEFGKKIGNDINTNKKTFLLTTALERAHKKQKSQIHRILQLPPSAAKIKAMKNIYLELSIHQIALHKIQQIHQNTIHSIQQLKTSRNNIKNQLITISELLIQRTK